MYPFFRLGLAMARAKRAPRLTLDGVSEIDMTAWPSDCDMFGEMNNGRHLTLCDFGRFDFGVRVGLMELVKKRGWGLVVGGASVRYRKRLLPFERFRLRTHIIAHDERWIYFQQSLIRNSEACSSALVRTAVTRGGSIIPTEEVGEALGFKGWRPDTPDWVTAWINADALRPWPPDPDLKAPARRSDA